METKRLLTSVFSGFTRRKIRLNHAHFLYGAVVASARDASLFERFRIPDTFDGRFEMMTVHLYILNDRLRKEGKEGQALSQEIFDLFIADMEASLRELGVGDQVVPKRLAKMTRVVHGRAAAYDLAREGGDNVTQNISSVVARNVFDGREPEKPELDMAGWILNRIDALDRIPLADLTKTVNLFATVAKPKERP